MEESERAAPLSIRQISRIIRTDRTKQVEEIQRKHQQYRNSFVAEVLQNQSRASTRLEERLSKKRKIQGKTVKQVQPTRKISAFEIEQKVINDPQDEGETGTCNKKNDGFGKIGRKVVDEKKGKCEKTGASDKNRP